MERKKKKTNILKVLHQTRLHCYRERRNNKTAFLQHKKPSGRNTRKLKKVGILWENTPCQILMIIVCLTMNKHRCKRFTHDVWTLKNFWLCPSIVYVVGSLKPKKDVIKKMIWFNPITLLKLRQGGKKFQKKNQGYSWHSITTFVTLVTKIITLWFHVATLLKKNRNNHNIVIFFALWLH